MDERFWSKVRKGLGCWLWQGAIGSHGYGNFKVTGGPFMTAHRFAYETVAGPIPDGRMVLHRCDVKPCVRPAHLYLGDATQNARDMMERGRARYKAHLGEDNGSAKLTAKEAVEIRRLCSAGVAQRHTAVRFGVSPATVSNIHTGKAWRAA